MESSPFKELHFTVDVKKLIPRGYTFQKLYSNNYKTYFKKVGAYKVWLWAKGRIIEINDWYELTNTIVEFYKNNLEQWKIENEKLPRPMPFMDIQLNRKTGEIQIRSREEYCDHMIAIHKKDNKAIEAYRNKYDNWSEFPLWIKDFELVLKEIKFLSS